MGARFDRWLARPSTLHLLRHLVTPAGVYPTSRHRAQCSAKRASATLAPARHSRPQELEQLEKAPWPESQPIDEASNLSASFRKVTSKPRRMRDNTKASEALGLSTLEYSSRMSFRSGPPLFEEALSSKSTFGELQREADVNRDGKDGNLLVNQAGSKHNMRLWVELIQFRVRIEGADGALDIWQGMRSRSIDLPTEGKEADILWPAFVNAACSSQVVNEDALENINAHAVELRHRTGQSYGGLYKCIVGSLLRRSLMKQAVRWHHKLTVNGVAPSDALKQVVIYVVRSTAPPLSFHAFKRMYNYGSAQRRLYDPCISELLAAEEDEAALQFHRLFLRRGDAPSAEMFATSGVQKLFHRDRDKSLPMKHKAKCAVQSNASKISPPPGSFPTMTRASMSGLLGDVHGIKPKEISDTFVAKLFATRAFSLDLVIRSLSFFAVEKLDSLTLREMAIRAGTPVEFCNRLVELRAQGIAIVDSAYSRLIQRLASGGQTELFNSLLASDQHPEAYEDTGTQEALLTSFLESSNLSQAHITLLDLSLLGKESHTRSWNRLLQHYLRGKDWHAVAHTMQTLRTQQLPLTVSTIRCLYTFLLPERRRRKRPVTFGRRDQQPFDSLDFVTNAAMYAEEQSKIIRPNFWQELLKRYGMAHRWGELEKLVLWLAERYSGPEFSASQRETSLKHVQRLSLHGKRRLILAERSPLDEIFDEQMVQAIFTWGFRAAAEQNKLHPTSSEAQSHGLGLDDDGTIGRNLHTVTPEPWAQGLALLLRLKTYRVSIRKHVICKAVAMRMWILFGPGVSALRINQVTRSKNRLSLGHYIRHANGIWYEQDKNEQLFDIDIDLLASDNPETESRLLLLLRTTYVNSRTPPSHRNSATKSVRGRRRMTSWLGRLLTPARHSPSSDSSRASERAAAQRFFRLTQPSMQQGIHGYSGSAYEHGRSGLPE